MKIYKPVTQLIPTFKGKYRLSRMFYKNIIDKKEEITFKIAKLNINVTVPHLVENVSFELFCNGNYEPEVVNFFAKSIPENGIFFDIGANIGAVSIVLAKTRPDIKIYAFEASPFVFKYLQKNIEQNNIPNVICINKAIHKLDNITLPFYSPKEKNGKGSFSNVFTTEAVEVETLNLDKFIIEQNIKPDIIKVDVEGYEKLIFESMQQYLSQSSNTQLLFEFVDWAEDLAQDCKSGDAQHFIKNLGYNLYELTANNITPIIEVRTKGSCNVLAKKNNA